MIAARHREDSGSDDEVDTRTPASIPDFADYAAAPLIDSPNQCLREGIDLATTILWTQGIEAKETQALGELLAHHSRPLGMAYLYEAFGFALEAAGSEVATQMFDLAARHAH